MAFYDLAGQGVQLLSSNQTFLFLDITNFGQGWSAGVAVPTNYYKLGLLRIQYQGSAYPWFPIDAAHMIIPLPRIYDALGYSLSPSTLIHVTEALI